MDSIWLSLKYLIVSDSIHIFCILQDQLHKREEEHARERKNLLEQLEKERRKSEKEKNDIDKKDLEVHRVILSF